MIFFAFIYLKQMQPATPDKLHAVECPRKYHASSCLRYTITIVQRQLVVDVDQNSDADIKTISGDAAVSTLEQIYSFNK